MPDNDTSTTTIETLSEQLLHARADGDMEAEARARWALAVEAGAAA